MTHSDDLGLVLPPKLAPIQVVIVPIYKNNEQLGAISEKASSILSSLKTAGITAKFDDDDSKKPGWKFAEYEMKGVPIRIAIGPRDLENSTVELARRDDLSKEFVATEHLVDHVQQTLADMQTKLYEKAKEFTHLNTRTANNIEELKSILDEDGGFVEGYWNGHAETEQKIKDLTKATIRCIPLGNHPTGKCILTGEEGAQKVVFASAY